VLFGAHFPVDVVVGAAVGHQFGLVAAGLLRVPTPVATTQSGSHLRVAAGCADACAPGR
jgi:membrane-associated phospholipid phosphatase